MYIHNDFVVFGTERILLVNHISAYAYMPTKFACMRKYKHIQLYLLVF